MTTRRCAIPAADLPAWLALGYRDCGTVAMGGRAEGPQRIVEWVGDGTPPEPERVTGATVDLRHGEQL